MSSNKESKIYLSFLAVASDKEKVKKAYHFFSENEINNFSLSLIITNPLSNESIEDIVSFFFMPVYFHINNKVLLNLVCDHNTIFEDAKKRLIDFSREQGIENLVVNHITEYKSEIDQMGNSQPQQNCIFYDAETLLVQYVKMLESEKIYNNIFFLNDSKNDVRSLYRLFQQAEDEIKIQNPQLYKIACNIQSLSFENNHLKKTSVCLANELDNYKTHIEILQSSHEAKVLQQYYDKEYETLPLWYKQFGHIIKVLMGKRSFRSLFNDNVKKYKD